MTRQAPRKMSDREEAMWAKIHEARDRATTALNDLSAHENICSQRYNGILEELRDQADTLKFQNRLMIGAGAACIGGMASIIVLLIQLVRAVPVQ